MIRSLAVVCCLVLGACGGGGSDLSFAVPPLAGPPPAGAQFSASEVGQGSFKMFFAQSIRDKTGVAPGNARISSGIIDVHSPETGKVVVTTAGGVQYVFVENLVTTLTPTNIQYDYVEENGGPNTLRIIRGDKGMRYGIFVIGQAINVNKTRANFYYGFPTAPSNLPAATATYFKNDGGSFFMSDGRRLQGGRVNLSADFANDKISGIVFDNFGRAQQGLQARVTLANGTLTNNGTFSANDLLAVTLVDSNTPVLATSDGANSLNGVIVGTNAEVAIGGYSGQVDVTTAGGVVTHDYSGVFQGQ